MIEDAIESKTHLPKKYNKLFKLWFLLGWPAFLSFIAIFFLMVFKTGMSTIKEPIFKAIFGDDWESLPVVIKKHYANLPYSDDSYNVEGRLDVMCKGLYWLLSPLIWLLKGIPPIKR